MRFYIAGPFFNQPQIDLIKTIEEILLDNSIPFFSPRQQHTPGGSTKIRSAEHAAAVFKCNYENLQDDCCSHVLAVADFLMPPDQGLFLIEKVEQKPELDREPQEDDDTGRTWMATIESGPISLPDTGTVWEMGFAFAVKKPVILFTLADSIRSLNLMLTQSCVGVLPGYKALRQFTSKGIDRLDASALVQWKGESI